MVFPDLSSYLTCKFCLYRISYFYYKCITLLDICLYVVIRNHSFILLNGECSRRVYFMKFRQGVKKCPKEDGEKEEKWEKKQEQQKEREKL